MKDIVNRKGILKIYMPTLTQGDNYITRKLFSEFFPLEIKHSYNGIYEYIGVSEHFEDVKDGESIPFYDCKFTIDKFNNDNVIICFEKQESDRINELLRRQELLAESLEKIGKLETKINGQDLLIVLDRANSGRRGEDREEI